MVAVSPTRVAGNCPSGMRAKGYLGIRRDPLRPASDVALDRYDNPCQGRVVRRIGRVGILADAAKRIVARRIEQQQCAVASPVERADTHARR